MSYLYVSLGWRKYIKENNMLSECSSRLKTVTKYFLAAIGLSKAFATRENLTLSLVIFKTMKFGQEIEMPEDI